MNHYPSEMERIEAESGTMTFREFARTRVGTWTVVVAGAAIAVGATVLTMNSYKTHDKIAQAEACATDNFLENTDRQYNDTLLGNGALVMLDEILNECIDEIGARVAPSVRAKMLERVEDNIRQSSLIQG